MWRTWASGPYLHDGQQSLLGVPHHLQRLLTASAQRRRKHSESSDPDQLLSQNFPLGPPHHLLKTPSTPAMPMPSTMSLDSLKGTVSGVGSVFPCSNATPESENTRAWGHALRRLDALKHASYLNRCGPARQSARRSECSGCVCPPDPRCSRLRRTKTRLGGSALLQATAASIWLWLTYGGGGYAAGVGQPFLHPHRRVQEALHAEVPEDGPEVATHLAVGLELLLEAGSSLR